MKRAPTQTRGIPRRATDRAALLSKAGARRDIMKRAERRLTDTMRAFEVQLRRLERLKQIEETQLKLRAAIEQQWNLTRRMLHRRFMISFDPHIGISPRLPLASRKEKLTVATFNCRTLNPARAVDS